MSISLPERFEAKVDRSDECHIWTGSKSSQGYGYIGYKGKVLKSHRVAATMAFGMFDQRLHVLHSCDNPPCVNPNHLWLGTNGENMRDRANKGRYVNQKKTHCPEGHSYSGGNLYISPSGYRNCRSCRQEATRRFNERKRAEL
jgi:hypothetical protein